ncbi:MAG: hypothetical protein IE928_05295 [Gammaproteobacteria bacterium]|nr:hypothetical protein [Gammaproteobacteria bacterium]
MHSHFLKPLFFCLSLVTMESLANHCIYINAYSPGYDWGDRIQKQFEKDAQQQCLITPYYLDAKHSSNEQLKEKGREIANLIKLAKPNIVIAADDASSQYVVQPYLRNSSIPVVYVGINWDPRPYGYPMNNATGMTEVWPRQEVMSILRHTVKTLTKLTIISADNSLERTDSRYIEQAAQEHQLTAESIFVRNFNDWKKAVVKAQDADAIFLGTNQGIADWDESQAIEWLKTHNQRFTFASQDFMRPYVMFSLSKSPEEFGSWAAKLTTAILAGNQPWQIPIIPNQQFTPYINESLLSLTTYELPAYIRRNAIVYRTQTP